jgi:hypothetical protein
MQIPSAPTKAGKHFNRARRLVVVAFCLAFGGSPCVLLAVHWHSKLLFVPAVICAVIGILGGIVAILYGWLSILFGQRQ